MPSSAEPSPTNTPPSSPPSSPMASSLSATPLASSMVSLPNISYVVSIKLDRTNYIIWKAQFLALLKSTGLIGYVDQTNPCPSQFTSDGVTPNPAYADWHKLDQQLLSWINSTLTPGVLSRVSRCPTARDAWISLEKRFNSQSRSRILQLKHQLQTTKCGTSSITDFVDQMTAVADSLALAGKPVDDDDLIDLILNGLGPAYESAVNSIQSRDPPMALDDVITFLLTAETRMAEYTPSMTSDSTTQVFYANRGHDFSNRGSSFSRGGHRGGFSSSRGGFSGPDSSPGRGILPLPSQAPLSMPVAPSRGGFSSPSYGSSPGFNGHCYNCGEYGHMARRCPRPPIAPQAMVASHTPTPSSTWFTDSGASAHIANDLAHLQLSQTYGGSDQVSVGNGQGLYISNIGFGSISQFHLNKVLHCPSASHNLLSVHQFALDNSVYFIFTPSDFYVKDLVSGKTLFHGKSENGLYPFRSPSSSSSFPTTAVALLGIRTSSPVWHQRLGHPSPVVFQKLSAHLPLRGSPRSSFCSHCPLGKSSRLPFQLSSSVSTVLLQLIHCDIWTSPVLSNKDSKILVENLLSVDRVCTIKSLQTDGGAEFLSHQFQHYLSTHGIFHRVSNPHTPEQNGAAEGKQRHLIDMALTLLATAHMPPSFWVEACYSLNYQGYRCYDPSTSRVYLSRHVVFYESTFPFQALSHTSSVPPSPVPPLPPLVVSSSPVVSPPPPSPSPQPPHSPPPLPTVTHVDVPASPVESSPPPFLPTTHTMVTHLRDGIRKPNPKYANLVFSQVSEIEPTLFQEANKSDQWRQAMLTKVQALHHNHTWDLVPPSPHRHALPCKWVFRIKCRSDGSIERPVVKHVTVRIILSLAFSRQWPIRLLDVTNAFLHGYLSEEVYMRQPRGFEDPKFPHHVCRLRKSLYGLKQSPRARFSRFSEFLIHSGFTASKADPSLFIFHKDDNFLFLLIYVDDIIVTGNALSQVNALLQSLNRQFAMKDLGDLHFFLGIEVQRTPDMLCLNQAKYAADLLKRATSHEANPCLTPVATGSQLSSLHGSPLSDPT
ncbi:unnamed protein product [Prunus armeniaca]